MAFSLQLGSGLLWVVGLILVLHGLGAVMLKWFRMEISPPMAAFAFRFGCGTAALALMLFGLAALGFLSPAAV